MICEVKDLPIYYETAGEGIPVLMIHGYYPDHRLMKGSLEPLFTNLPGWQRIYFDLPGMGQTPARDWIQSSDDMLAVVEAFVERVIPDGSFVVMGESYGGYLTRGLIYHHAPRVLGACFICPSIIPVQAQRDVPPHEVLVRTEGLCAGLTAAEAEEFQSITVIQTPHHLERFMEEIQPGLRLANAPFLEGIRKGSFAFSFPVDDPPKPFPRPALFLCGRQDSSTGYRDAWKILENYPRASFVVLDSAGHNLQIEQETLFAGLVTEFLQRTVRDQPAK